MFLDVVSTYTKCTMNDFALAPRRDLLNFKCHTVTNGTDLRKSPLSCTKGQNPQCNATTQYIALNIVLHICSRIQDLPDLFLGQKRKSHFVRQHFYNKSIATAGQGCLHCQQFARLLVLALYCCLLGEKVSAYVGTFLVAFLQLLPAFLQLAVDQLFCLIPSRS